MTPLPEQINFVSWYQSELQALLQASTAAACLLSCLLLYGPNQYRRKA